jgi:hypothetical protein
MRKWLLILVSCLALTAVGCAEDFEYDDPPAVASASGSVEFCDDLGCRMVDAPYYYSNGEVIYWDAGFGVWMGPRGYWGGGGWHRGFVPGYHEHYHVGFYHSFRGNPGGWRAGSGGRGFSHGGGGHGGGGHGGGHR